MFERVYVSTNWKLVYSTKDREKAKNKIGDLSMKGKKADYRKVGKTYKVYVRKD
jgi:hypothetical protein